MHTCVFAYFYQSKKCIPNFKKLTEEDPLYIESPKLVSNESPKSMSNDSQDPFNLNFYY